MPEGRFYWSFTTTRIGDWGVSSLRKAILALAPVQGSIERHRLHTLCAERLRKAIRDPDFEAAIASLEQAGDVAREGERVRRIEPDFKEALLEDGVERWLRSEECNVALRIDPDQRVFHRTATGGAQGTGLYSRPDFTMAVIRRLKYDPLRHLDVITFELKNAQGANLMAVHEALAHTRFGHYSYLVCPRSRLCPEDTQSIHSACAEHGLGLILFTIASPAPPPNLTEFDVVLHATRKSPDPYVVEAFLEARLPDTALVRLEKLAGA